MKRLLPYAVILFAAAHVPARGQNTMDQIGVNDTRTPQQKVEALQKIKNSIGELFKQGANAGGVAAALDQVVPSRARAAFEIIKDQVIERSGISKSADPYLEGLQEIVRSNDGVIPDDRLRALACAANPALALCQPQALPDERPRAAVGATCGPVPNLTCVPSGPSIESIRSKPRQNYTIQCSRNTGERIAEDRAVAAGNWLANYSCEVSGSNILARSTGFTLRPRGTFVGEKFSAPCIPCLN